MGKKTRKTRWRALSITDEQSDSEESHTAGSHQHQQTKSHAYQQHQNKYYSKLPYSSHSTPTRRYPYDQSTRSSSTASENKITFNEDEYTKITTPRQDVLFKKGYLNKPKNYMTQTSTGNSTTSTGNSTGNGTPDHHSADGTEGTDLEYESSQFVYPNGFVDQNGIYYINSYEPYPLVVYNAPFCFPEYQNVKTKRYSTGSLTESTSPNNEEVTSQDLNQEVVPTNNPPEYGPVYNVVYPGFYYNGNIPQENDVVVNGQQQETRRLKKRRRRKLSKTKTHDDATSEYTDETSEDEGDNKNLPHRTNGDVTTKTKETESAKVEETSIKETAKSTNENSGSLKEESKKGEAQSCDITECHRSPIDSNIPNGVQQNGIVQDTNCDNTTKMTSLKVDAQEFVPRAYRQPLEYVNYQPNLVPVPFIPAPNFIPPLQPIPINFIPQFITSATPTDTTEVNSETETNVPNRDKTERVVPTPNETLPRNKPQQSVDIEKIVLKLEEAAKEQQMNEKKKKKYQKVRPQFEKRRYQKTYVGNPKQPLEETQKEQPKQPVYAEMLKKTQKYQRYEQKPPPKVVQTKKPTPEVTLEQTNTSPLKAKSQWISVSSRKKRKNKTLEEADEIEDNEDADEFESYDVSMLVDIVPPSSMGGEKTQQDTEGDKKESLDVGVSGESAPQKELGVETPENPKGTAIVDTKNTEVMVQTEESMGAKKDVDINVNVMVDTKPSKVVPQDLPQTPTEEVFVDVAINKEVKVVESDPKKKKGKKTTPKTKRVIITDAIFVVQPEKEATPKIEVVEEKLTKQVEPKTPEPNNNVQESTPTKTLEEKEDKDKKAKKKKKKAPPKVVSASSSNTTLNLDDSYDFLIDGNVLNTEDKTNVEMSQEIDRMIQKGMYNSLEEKIKSLDIGFVADGFFKSVAFTAPKPAVFDAAFVNRKATKSGFTITTNTEGRKEPKPSTSKSGDFFDGTTTTNGDGDEEKKTPNQLYPITRAVREWMDKTRETTPEVEILKSPSTIYKEFCESDEDTEMATSSEDSQKNLDVNPPLRTNEKGPKTGARVDNFDDDDLDNDDDKELTVFPQENDLLECWEDEISSPPPTVLSKRTHAPQASEKTIEKAEDVLEIYESKYGKNEDYLKLKAEIEEKMKTYPKHGNLPYRAICCNIM